MRKYERKTVVYVNFMNLGNAYDMIWRMYVNKDKRIKGGGRVSVSVTVDSDVRQCCIFPLLFNIYIYIYINEVMKKVKIGMGRMGVSFQEKGIEWRLTYL